MYRVLLRKLSPSHTIRSFALCSSALCFLAMAGLASEAEAQSDEAMSEAFFDEAIVLRNSGQWQAACDKFLQSQKLSGARGTLQNLGECNAKLGKFATAWGYYKELLGKAEAAGDQARMLIATTQIEALRAQVPKLTLEVGASEKIAGLSITLNGEALATVLFDESAPRDPGHYVLVVKAPGHDDWSTEIDIKVGESYTIRMPGLQARPGHASDGDLSDKNLVTTGAGAGAGAEAEATRDTSPDRTMAYIAGGVGIAALGVGSYFGFSAKSDLDRADDDHCNSERVCDARGVQLVQSGQDSANWSTAAFLVGGAALTAGVVLYLRGGGSGSSDKTSGAQQARTVQLAPAVYPGGASLILSGGF